MAVYFLLDNGVLSNFPPERYSERQVSAVITMNDAISPDERHMRVWDTTEALEEMKFKGKKETLDNVLDLMHKSVFFRASVENPI